MAETELLASAGEASDAERAGAEVVVAVASYNNASTIAEVLHSVARRVADRFPRGSVALLHADGGSTDGTVEAARRAHVDGVRWLPLSAGSNQPAAPGAQLHRGAVIRGVFESAKQLGA